MTSAPGCSRVTEPYALAFWHTRHQLFSNVLAASGLTFAQAEANPQRAVFPHMSDLPPDELAAAYLAGTPFLEFVRTPVAFVIPRNAYRAHTAIFGPSDHGKTQTIQHIVAGFMNEPDPPALFIMDSMGAMLRKIQELAVFEEHLKGRLVVLDPAGPRPPKLNFFKLSGGSPAQQMEILFYLFKALDQSLTARMRTTVTFLTQLMRAIDGSFTDLRNVCEEKKPQHVDVINALPTAARDCFLTASTSPTS